MSAPRAFLIARQHARSAIWTFFHLTPRFRSGIRTPNLLDQSQALCLVELSGISTPDGNRTRNHPL